MPGSFLAFTASVTSLIAETKYPTPKVEGGKVYLARFVELSMKVGWRQGWAARRRGIAKEQQSMAGRRQQSSKVAKRQQQPNPLLYPFLSTCPLGGATNTQGGPSQNCAEPIGELI